MDFPEGSHMKAPGGFKILWGLFLKSGGIFQNHVTKDQGTGSIDCGSSFDVHFRGWGQPNLNWQFR